MLLGVLGCMRRIEVVFIGALIFFPVLRPRLYSRAGLSGCAAIRAFYFLPAVAESKQRRPPLDEKELKTDFGR